MLKLQVLQAVFSSLLLMKCHLGSAVSLPVLYTKGTHYEIGRDMGHTFKSQINEFFALDPLLRSEMVPYANSQEGKVVVQGFLESVQKAFPWMIDEMHGIADGANVTYQEVLLINLRMEMWAAINNIPTTKYKTRDSGPESCSDVLLNDPANKMVVIAHNEDTGPLVKTRAFILHAEIVENKKGQNVTVSKFTAYTYPGYLPGNAFSFNDNFVFTVNALYPNLYAEKKLGRYFLTRALLECKSVNEAINLLQNAKGIGSAFGFDVNIGDMATKRIMNIETAPVKDAPKINSSSIVIPKGFWYYHVNKYRRIQIDEIPSHIESSIHRSNRFEQFTAPHSFDDLKAMLGDTQDKDFPIYRQPTSKDPAITAATAITDLLGCKMDIYLDNPKYSDPLFTLMLPCHGKPKINKSLEQLDKNKNRTKLLLKMMNIWKP